MEGSIPYESIPEYPEKVCAGAILARLTDGLAFRFRWATHGLREEDLAFKPSPESMSLLEITGHIWGLVNWVTLSVTDRKPEKPEDFEALRGAILEMLGALRNDFALADDARLQECSIGRQPFWHIINGPLADALTHVGQLSAFRRLTGNPTPRADVFRGLPPKA